MRWQWLPIPLLLALQACSGTPFGQKLADSFDSPPPPPSSEPEKSKSTEKKESTTQLSQSTKPEDRLPSDHSEKDIPVEESTTNQTTKKESEVPVRLMPAKPRPYRITIRLAAADPAAPAEGVTDALRRAGIGFEVETIEKISLPEASKETVNGSSGQPDM